MDVEKTIRAYMPQIIHLSLGTSRNNVPWVSEVHYSYDEDLNLYFHSLPLSRHGQEIAANPKVAGTIVTQHVMGEKPLGIYFEGVARLVKDGFEFQRALEVYEKRFELSDKFKEEIVTRPEGRKLFKISVDTFYVFDTRESIPSQRYTLEWNSGR